VDSAAIRALLANASAQIREVTLDALVARSVEHTDWHDPLVRRPSLSPRAAQMLSEIVATHLLEVLATRADLAPPLAEELRHRIAARLVPDPCVAPARHDMTADEALARAHALANSGELVEEAILEAARHGEARYATALLAVAADMPVSVIDRAASLRSSKGLVSLAWKAGFTMRAAVAMQTMLARLPPDAVLTARQDDSFPLSLDEMRWQLDFLGRMER
jgi:acetyl esterase/lipase